MHIRCSIFALLFASLLSIGRIEAATTIPFRYQDGMIWLKVRVAEQSEPLNFLLDSGAGATVVDLATARRLGLKLGGRRDVLGVHGRAEAYRVEALDAYVGDAGVRVAARPLALDLSEPSAGCCRHIDGLIGVDFFRDHIVRIDFATQTIRLLQAAEVNSAGCEILPLTKRNDTLCARISVDGNAPECLRLDTGCDTALEWVVTGARAKKLALPTVGFQTKSVRQVETCVQLGAVHLVAIKAGLHAEPIFTGESGLIGNGLLSRFIVTIDAAQCRCLLASR